MRPRLLFTLFAAGAVLAACTTPPPAPTPAASAPMSGTSAGAAPDSGLSAAASERAGAGCPVVTSGPSRLVTRGEGPVVLHSGVAQGSVGDPSRRLAAGGTGDSCN